MRVGLSLVVMLALGSSAAAQLQPEPRPLPPQPRIIGEIVGEQRYCLMDRSSGTMNCGFATWDQCQQASTVGRDGDCDVNPRLTTGSGVRDIQD